MQRERREGAEWVSFCVADTGIGKDMHSIIGQGKIDRLLDEGRVSSDQAERTKIYEDLNRQFAKEVHNVWLTWTKWGVISAPTVHGVMGPKVDGNEPFPGLATGQPVSGLWVEQG